jgi:hypothetical protein
MLCIHPVSPLGQVYERMVLVHLKAFEHVREAFGSGQDGIFN